MILRKHENRADEGSIVYESTGKGRAAAAVDLQGFATWKKVVWHKRDGARIITSHTVPSGIGSANLRKKQKPKAGKQTGWRWICQPVMKSLGDINIRYGEFTVELQNGCDPQRIFEVLRMLKALWQYVDFLPRPLSTFPANILICENPSMDWQP